MSHLLKFTVRVVISTLLALIFAVTLLIAANSIGAIASIEDSLQRHVAQYLLERPTMDIVMTTLQQQQFALWLAIALNILWLMLFAVTRYRARRQTSDTH